jgi:integrase
MPGDLALIDFETYLTAWQNDFVARRGRMPAAATVKGQITALKTFFDYVDRADQLKDADDRLVRNRAALLEAPRPKRAVNDWLQDEEDKALLEWRGSLVDEFLIAFLRWAGLRIGEARAVRISHLTLGRGEGTLTIPDAKTPAGQRIIPLNPEFLPILNRWLDDLESRDLYRPNGPLLATRRGTPIYEQQLWRMVKRIAADAGVRVIDCSCGATTLNFHAASCARGSTGANRSEVAPHTLRKTYGSYLLNRGARIEVVSKLLGHASTTITEQVYAQLLDTTIKREFYDALGLRQMP